MENSQIALTPPEHSEHQHTEASLLKKRAVLYARVSSDDRGKDGRNLKSQLDMCREYALSHGYQIVAELAEDDRGASGAAFELPELGHVLEMAEASEMEILIVREIDRLSRNLVKQLIVEQELKRTSASIEYVIGEYPDTPEGNLNKHIRASIAEFEREQIKARNVRGRRNIVRNGKIMLHGDQPPYGYRVSKDGSTLVPYEPEAQVIELIFLWYTVGDETGKQLSMIKIAKKLTEMQVPTWGDIHGRTNKKRGFGEWATANVCDILHCETYMGKWHYGEHNRRGTNPREHWIELDVPPLVSIQVWQAAQDKAKQNKLTPERNAVNKYLMRRLLRCSCGYSVESYAQYHNGKTYLYYRCISVGAETARGHCGTFAFRADKVDAAIWGWVREYLQEPQKLKEGLEAYRNDQDKLNAPLHARLKVVEDLLEDNNAQLARLLDLYLGGAFPKEMLTERKAKLEGIIVGLRQERARLVMQLEQGNLQAETIQEIVDFAAKIAQGLGEADKNFQARRHIIELLDVRAVLAIENGEKVIYPSFYLSPTEGAIRLDLLGNDNQYS